MQDWVLWVAGIPASSIPRTTIRQVCRDVLGTQISLFAPKFAGTSGSDFVAISGKRSYGDSTFSKRRCQECGVNRWRNASKEHGGRSRAGMDERMRISLLDYQASWIMDSIEKVSGANDFQIQLRFKGSTRKAGSTPRKWPAEGRLPRWRACQISGLRRLIIWRSSPIAQRRIVD
jgi:hypothetical protein